MHKGRRVEIARQGSLIRIEPRLCDKIQPRGHGWKSFGGVDGIVHSEHGTRLNIHINSKLPASRNKVEGFAFEARKLIESGRLEVVRHIGSAQRAVGAAVVLILVA